MRSLSLLPLLFYADVAVQSCGASVALGDAPNSTAVWRWPYPSSPYVVQQNPRDGLPDFSWFDASNESLTEQTIACPQVLQRQCTHDKHFPGDEKCGADGLHGCHGGLYCDVSHHQLVDAHLQDQFFPNYEGPGDKVKSIPRSRKNILQRAIGWLATHSPYIGCQVPKLKHDGIETCAADDDEKCPQRAYTLTCCGLIEMAWSSPNYGGGGDDAVTIHHSELLPGDALLYTKFNTTTGHETGIAHFLMFREWIEVNRSARVYQMGGG